MRKIIFFKEISKFPVGFFQNNKKTIEEWLKNNNYPSIKNIGDNSFVENKNDYIYPVHIYVSNILKKGRITEFIKKPEDLKGRYIEHTVYMNNYDSKTLVNDKSQSIFNNEVTHINTFSNYLDFHLKYNGKKNGILSFGCITLSEKRSIYGKKAEIKEINWSGPGKLPADCVIEKVEEIKEMVSFNNVQKCYKITTNKGILDIILDSYNLKTDYVDDFTYLDNEEFNYSLSMRHYINKTSEEINKIDEVQNNIFWCKNDIAEIEKIVDKAIKKLDGFLFIMKVYVNTGFLDTTYSIPKQKYLKLCDSDLCQVYDVSMHYKI